MIQNQVYLEPIKHKYYYRDSGKELTSVSKVLDSLKEFVDWDKIAGNVAGKGKFKDYPTKQDVLDFWKANAKEATDFGTDQHEMQERYAKEFKVLDKDKVWEGTIKKISAFFSKYYKSEDEACVFSRKYNVAGTMDKGLFLKKGSKLFAIADYKTALKTGELDYVNDKGKFLVGPVSHLQDCKYIRYCLQLAIYSILAEECAGLITTELFIVFLPSDPNGEPYKIPVPFMKLEAEAILEHFYNSNNITILANTNLNEVPTFD